METKISLAKKWVNDGGWKGHEEPIYWIAGCNDTGTFSDSPCPTNVAMKELLIVKKMLKENGIHYRQMVCKSSNVFCIRRYLVVSPFDFEKAREIVNKEYKNGLRCSTMLLYVNDEGGNNE